MNDNKLIIHTPDKIDGEIEDFKLDRFEDGKNFSTAKIKLTRNAETEKPVLWYSKELIRNHRDPGDPFSKMQILKPFTTSNMEAISDETLTQKFKDTVLAFKNQIPDYAPLTDIHSEKMRVFVDEDTAQFIEDIGVSLDGLGSDFSQMESVDANPFYLDVASDASRLKEKLHELGCQISKIKELIADEFEVYCDPKTLSHDEFNSQMAQQKVPENLTQRYLSLLEDKEVLTSRLKEINHEVFSETTQKIRLPKKIMEGDYEWAL